MATPDPTPGPAARARRIVIGALLVAAVASLLGIIMNQRTDELRAVDRLPPSERASFIHGECEALRALCDLSEPSATCIERAQVLHQLEGLDAGCQTLADRLGGPRRYSAVHLR